MQTFITEKINYSSENSHVKTIFMSIILSRIRRLFSKLTWNNK